MASSKQPTGQYVLFMEVKVRPKGQEFHARELGVQGQKKMIFLDERVLQAGKCLTVTNRDKVTKLFNERWVCSHVSCPWISTTGTLDLRH